MIDRSRLVGTFPDERVCWFVFALCAAVATLLLVIAALSWFKGGRCGS